MIMTSIAEVAAVPGAEIKDEIESETDYPVFHFRESASVSGSMLSASATVGIYIATTGGSAIVGATFKDVYERVKRYLSKQIEKHRTKEIDEAKVFKEIDVTIYGPDGKPLKKIRTRAFREIEEIDP